jgi:phosphomannomutase / phosphoglucomutase
MHDNAFRAYDIRGIVNEEIIIDTIFDLTCALVAHMHALEPMLNTIAIGIDGRIHSPDIKKHVCAALSASGINIIDCGLVPTPLIYFASHILPVQACIMITASHNGPTHNGLKFVLNREPLMGDDIIKIKKRYDNRERIFINPTHTPTYNTYDIKHEYIHYLTKHFKHLKSTALPVSIDCLNGAAGAIMPALIKALDLRSTQLINNTIDGTFPHGNPDPTQEQNIQILRKNVIEHNHMLGIGFDGDADRMAALTETGRLISGDELIAIFAHDIIHNNIEKKPQTIIYEVKCSSMLTQLIQSWDALPIITRCGHGYIKQAMKKHKALFGGELSCHFCFSDRYFGYDDGIYAFLRLYELMIKKQTSLELLCSILPSMITSQELRIKTTYAQTCAIIKKIKEFFITRHEWQCNTIDGIRIENEHSLAIIRQSNTENVISMRFAGTTEKNLATIQSLCAQALDSYEYLISDNTLL